MNKILKQFWYLSQFSRQQWYNEDKLRSLQNTKLKKILRHSLSVPYYRKLYKSKNIDIENICGVEDTEKIPVIDNDCIRRNPRSFLSDKFDINKLHCRLTSGSSGHPTKIYIDPETDMIQNAVSRRAFEANGVGLRDHIIIFGDTSHSSKRTFIQKLGFLKKTLLSSAEDVSKQVRNLSSIKGDFVYGYSNTLFIISKYSLENKVKLPTYKGIFGTAEILSSKMRQTIEKAFNQKVVDLFGSQEFIRTAWECPEHEGYHVDIDHVYLEILTEDGSKTKPGEVGEMVLTSFSNFAMPFIRYRTGDMIRRINRKCNCGRSLPLIGIEYGRKWDLIKLKDGSLFSPGNFANMFRVIPGVSQFQVVQDSVEEFTVNIVPSEDYSDKTGNDIRLSFQKNLEQKCKVKIKKYKAIPLIANKYRPVICNC